MNTLFIGKNFIELPEVGSTNDFAQELLATGPPEGTVIFTPNQTAGRGQQGNQWHSEPGQNIAFTLVLFPKFLPAEKVFLLNKILSCALWDAFSEILLPHTSAEVHIKWPNDLLVTGHKVAGMLLENQFEKGRVASTLIGIGVNVNQRDFPAIAYGPATSLGAVADQTFDLKTVLGRILQKIEARYLQLQAGHLPRIAHDYLQHLFAYQEDLEMEVRGQRETVHLVGVDAHGRLALQRPTASTGKLEFFGIKEVRFLL